MSTAWGHREAQRATFHLLHDAAAGVRRWLGAHRAVRELVLVVTLYAGYTVSRTLADGHLAPALERAGRIVDVERSWHLAVEPWLNTLFVEHRVLGILGDYWYASAHYVVTVALIVWLFVRRPALYVHARRALVAATVVALAFYLTSPTAPPRMGFGFTDVMSLHATAGWWGADASAPRGLGGLTNELAAFPSMHAGWALWAALAVRTTLCHPLARAATFLYPLTTAVVVLGTGNHWTLDVLVGFLIMGAAWWVTGQARQPRQLPVPARPASPAES
ncbi:MAG: phosphatase PAP2 family protein [Nocardioides sp.]|uniref:phosphatase PAP2 family protein n=1 Tax=Nocardioides sp. TaxID=35761 RepID=UPI0039E3F4AD